MSAQPNFFRIGVFILVGFALLAAGLVAFGAGAFFKKRIYFETYINASVQGVDAGTPVKFRGVPIGSVKSITFAFNEYGTPNEVDKYNYVVILMEIDKEMFPGMFSENLTGLIKQNVEQGMRARIEPMGITGMNYIDINYVKDPADFPPLTINWTPHYYYIPSAPGQLTSILDSVNNIMGEMKKLNLGDLQTGLNNLLMNLNKAVVEADIPKVSQEFQALVTNFNQALDAADLGTLSDDARKLMAGLQRSNSDLQRVLRSMDPEEMRRVIKNLDDTTKNLEAFSSSIRQRPSSLLWGSPPKPETKPKRGR